MKKVLAIFAVLFIFSSTFAFAGGGRNQVNTEKQTEERSRAGGDEETGGIEEQKRAQAKTR